MPVVLQPGTTGEPLPENVDVFRLIKASKDGRASETAFILSSEDEAGGLQSLSVWAAELTTQVQARNFFPPEKQPDYSLCAILNVNEIRALRPEPDSPSVPVLDVVWDPLSTTAPGAEGHAGIIGLAKPSGLPNAKLYYRSLRSQLADLANRRLSPLP